jgi:bifunctional non-homologous end joining protein LigD
MRTKLMTAFVAENGDTQVEVKLERVGGGAVGRSRRPYALQSSPHEIARGLKGIRSRPFPELVEPALTTQDPKAPAGYRWAHEIKFDGCRAQLRKRDAGTKVRAARLLCHPAFKGIRQDLMA